MANVGSLGGINIQFGADIGDLNRALRGMESEVQDFAKKLGNIALEGVIKGDPFSATTKYMKAAGKQLNSVFKEWAGSIEAFDHQMDKTAERAKVNAAKITNAITKQSKQAGRELKGLALIFQQAMSNLNIKSMGIGKKGVPGTADIRKAYSKHFRETLNMFRGFNKDINTVLDDLAAKSKAKSGLTSEYIQEAIVKINKLLVKDKDRMHELVPKTQVETVKQLGEELQKAFKVQQALEQLSRVRGADSDEAAKKRKIEQLKDIRAREKQLLADQRQGIEVNKKLIALYQEKLALGVGLTKAQQARMPQAEAPVSVEEKRLNKLRDIRKQEKELLQEQRLGVNVNKELVALYEKKLKLGVSLTKAQQARMPVSESPATVAEKRLEKLRAIRKQEKDLLAEQKLGIDVNQRLVALYEKKLSLGVRLTKAQQARRFNTGEQDLRDEMAVLEAAIKKVVTAKKNGQNVDEDLEKLLLKRISLQERLNKVQRLRSPTAPGSYAEAEQQKLVKLKEIDDIEKKLLAKAANGVNVEKELVALYQRKLQLGEALTKHQQSRMPNAEKDKVALTEELRAKEQHLLGLKRTGLNVDQELLSLYKKMDNLVGGLNAGQQKRVNDIQRAVNLERNLAGESKKTTKAKEEVVQIGKSTYEETKKGLRLEELVTKEAKKQEQLEKRREARVKRSRAAMIKNRSEEISLARIESGKGSRGGTKEFRNEREIMAAIRAEEKLAKVKKMRMEYDRSSIGLERKYTKEAEKQREAIERLNAELREGYNVEKNKGEVLRRLQAIQASGIKLTRKEASVLKSLSAAQARVNKTTNNMKAAHSGLVGVLSRMTRLAWFIRLRAYWAMYQAVGSAARDLVEAHTHLSRALRTARSNLYSTTEIAEQYHQAMKDIVMLHGTGWEEAGEVLYQLGSAGLSAEEALSALQSTMTLIVATEGDARDTTKAIAGIYNNYGDSIEGASSNLEKFEKINDLVAKAWSEHQVEISELTDGYKMSIAMTKAAGLSLSDLTAILSVANDHMIKGGRAGRALQNVFMRISRSPIAFAKAFGLSKEEFDPGQPLEFAKVMELLADRMHGGALSAYELSRNFERLGLRGGPIFTTLLQNWEKVEKAMLDFQDTSGTAARIEETRLDNLESKYKQFLGALKAAIQDLTPIVNLLKDALQGLLDQITKARAAKVRRGLLSGEAEATAENLLRLEEDEKRLTKLAEKVAKYRQYIRDREVEKQRQSGVEDSLIRIPTDAEVTQKLLDPFYAARKTFEDQEAAELPFKLGAIPILDKIEQSRMEQISELISPDKPTQIEVADVGHLKEVQEMIFHIRSALGLLDEESEGTEDEVEDTVSKILSDAQRRVERFMVQNDIGDVFKLDPNANPVAMFEKLDMSKVGGEFEDFIDRIVRAKEILYAVDKKYAGTPIVAIDDAAAAKKLIYLRRNILEVNEDIKAVEEEIAEARENTVKKYALTVDEFNRAEAFASIEEDAMKRLNTLEQEREGILKSMVDIAKTESNSLEDKVLATRRAYEFDKKAIQTAIVRAKMLGVTAQEETTLNNLIDDRHAKALDINALTEATGLLRTDIADGEKAELTRKREAADLAADEAQSTSHLTVLKLRNKSIQDQYNAGLKQTATHYANLQKDYERNNATAKETLILKDAELKATKQVYINLVDELKIRRDLFEDEEDKLEVTLQILKLESKISGLKEDQVGVNDELRKQNEVMYDIFRRLEERSRDIRSHWHDIVDTFTMGMVQGLAEMWTSWISGSQEVQQEIINLEGEIEALEQQADAIEEKGLFSYEEAQNLQNINEEIAELNDQIKDLEDPIEVAKEQFKNFFKALIDQINLVIARLIIMRILSGVMSAAGNYNTGVPAAGGSPWEEPTFARGGVTNRIKAFRRFSNGGITGNPMMAILGDNPSGKELVIPAENISKDGVSGYAQEAKQPINVVNVLSKEDIAAAMASKEGERVVINLIGRDLNNNGPIARRLNI